MRKAAFLSLLLIVLLRTEAQRYIVRFKDKSFSAYALSNPSGFLSARAIERRQRFSVALDSTDLPVTTRYLDSLQAIPGVTVLNASKWLNQVSIQVSDPVALTKINSFPFVISSNRIASRTRAEASITDKFKETRTAEPLTETASQKTAADVYNYGNSSAQVRIHNGEFLHNIGLRGQDMIIGMLDAGYRNYTSLTAFDSARTNGQILGTWDFVSKNNIVADDDQHGTQCFSTIAASIPGTFIGTAPKANFYLFRTEDVSSEYPVEEHNWVCGAERIDSAGGDLISSSLGYFQFSEAAFNYTYADMNGNRTMAAVGADLAAKKGLLVINSIGNEGNKAWRYLMTPADGDSVLAVGAVNAAGQVGGFSSYGPSADGRVKPDVASIGVGTIVQNANGVITGGNGTSFSCPNMAGLITCLMQGFPEYNNMKIIAAVRKAGSIASSPNDRIGYGIPDMKKAVMGLLKDFAFSAATTSDCIASFSWTSKDVSAMKYEIERKGPGETSFKKIAERHGTGNIFSTHTYQLKDTLYGFAEGEVMYRIKQYIDTAAATVMADYMDTATITTGALCALNDLGVLLQSLKQTAASTVSFANCKTMLSWTSKDIAAMKYEIERKLPSETSFKKIAERNGTGTVFAPHSYQLSDSLAGVSAGTIQYRIRQIVDTSGLNFKGDHIDTASTEISPSCALTETFTILPNPANNQFILQTNTAAPIPNMMIRIVSASGQTIMMLKKTKPAGIMNFEISIPHFSRGKYFVSVYNNQQLLATKDLIKL